MPPTITIESAVEQYAPLVRRLALRIVSRLPAYVDVDDLIQAGMIGLIDAVSKFKDSGQAQFETYAYMRINGAIMDELRSLDWMPRTARAKSNRLDEAILELEQKLLRAPNEKEIAKHLGMNEAEFLNFLKDAQNPNFLDVDRLNADADKDSDFSFDDVLSDESLNANPDRMFDNTRFREDLIDAISSLSEREKIILSLSYEQDMNLEEIGLTLDLSAGRISQIRSLTMSRLRAKLKKKGWENKHNHNFKITDLLQYTPAP